MRPMMPMRPPMAGFPGCPNGETERNEPFLRLWLVCICINILINISLILHIFDVGLYIIPFFQRLLIYGQNEYILGCESQPTSIWKWRIFWDPFSTYNMILANGKRLKMDWFLTQRACHGIVIFVVVNCTKIDRPKHRIFGCALFFEVFWVGGERVQRFTLGEQFWKIFPCKSKTIKIIVPWNCWL